MIAVVEDEPLTLKDEGPNTILKIVSGNHGDRRLDVLLGPLKPFLGLVSSSLCFAGVKALCDVPAKVSSSIQ